MTIRFLFVYLQKKNSISFYINRINGGEYEVNDRPMASILCLLDDYILTNIIRFFFVVLNI